MEENEEWFDIPSYEGLYKITKSGLIKCLEKNGNLTSRIKKYVFSTKGYIQYDLNKNGKRKSFPLHKLLAITFLGHNQCGYQEVINHIDGNILNNSLDNLELVSSRYNTSDGYLRKVKSSRYTGVSIHKQTQRWATEIRNGKLRARLGLYSTEEEASRVYQLALNNIRYFINTYEFKTLIIYLHKHNLKEPI